MACLNLNIPQVRKDYEELTKIFNNESIAYGLLSLNNSYNLDLDFDGNPSRLYSDLMDLESIDGNRAEAIRQKAKVYTPSFLERYGDWLNNKLDEPLIGHTIFDELKLHSAKYSTIPGKAVDFLTKQGKYNVSKVLDTAIYNPENKDKWKDVKRMKNMLSLSSTDFQENGLYIHKQNPYIMYLNGELFENIIDQPKIIEQLNDSMIEGRKKENLTPHTVIHTKKTKEGDIQYWVTSTDKKFTKEMPYEEHERRRAAILTRNAKAISDLNTKVAMAVGRQEDVIVVNEVRSTDKKLIGFTVTFNEDIMKEYNSHVYTNYVNAVKKYFNSLDSDIDESFTVEPLVYNLKKEVKSLNKEKASLEKKGSKQVEINKIDNKVREIKDRLEIIQKDSNLSDIYNEAEIQLKEIEEIANSVKVSPEQLAEANKKVNMWIKSGDFSQDDHIFLDEEQVQSQEVRNRFYQIKGRAEELLRKLNIKGKDVITASVNDKFGTKLTFDKIVSLTHKLGVMNMGLSLNRVGHALAQFIQSIVNDSNDTAHREAMIESRKLKELYTAMKTTGFDDRDFYQRKENGTLTGRMVHKFSDLFYKTAYAKHNGIKNIDTVEFRKEKMLTLNPKLLFDTEGSAHDKHVQEIVDNLGEVEARKYIEKARVKWQDYQKVKTDHIAVEYGNNQLTEEQQKELNEWIYKNSPIERIKNISRSNMQLTSQVIGKDTFLEIVPKKYNTKGELTGFIDENFSKIENNKAAYDFYQRAEEITKTSQVNMGYGDFSSTSLAYIERSVLSKLGQAGVSNFLSKEVLDNVIESFEGGQPKASQIDPVTGQIVHTIKQSTEAIDVRINRIYHKKISNLGEDISVDDLTTSQKEGLYAEASKEVFNNMAFEKDNNVLFQSLNTLNLAALTFKHASQIEDTVNLAMSYLPNSTVNIGDEIIDQKGNVVGQQYVEQLQKQVQYFLDTQYYKEPKGDTSSVLGRVRTTEQKEKVKQIKEKLDNPDITEEEKLVLNEELKTIGVKVTVNSLVRRLMDFLRLKGLGWNVTAGLCNLAYGTITNMYKAAEGRKFTLSDWLKAEKEYFSSHKKFNRIVENYHIIGDVLYQFNETNRFDNGTNWFHKVIKSASPYAMQTSIEKKNQGTTMIAMMLSQKVTNSKGETKPLWEAINEEGQLSDEWSIGNKSGDGAIIGMIGSIKDQNQEIHGDYSNAILLEKSTWGKALIMFRKWFFEGYHNRLGAEKMDYTRGIMTKGRYISAFQLAKQFNLNPFALYNAYKNNELSEVDKANVRGNIAEMLTMIGSLVIQALLKNAICGDGESRKCKDANMVSLIVLNNYKKLVGDITYWGPNPIAWKNFVTSPTALTSFLADFYELYNLTYIALFGEDEDLIYKTGPNKDRNKFEVLFKKQIPFINQIERVKKYSEDIVDSGKSN